MSKPSHAVSAAITTLELVPSVVKEQQITLLKFYWVHAVRDGMVYRNELYGLAKEFDGSNRLEAYRFGCELIEQGVPTIISVSKQQYRVWVSLRNPLATIFIAS
ncbi:hypothetical protein NDI52_32375 [Leptolyngbya sp. PL-A3]|uniref:hypothetical protein n=1 Tax=Leptolyngbya sp. PL-A3 TaxID=2933911 RepID=UPI003297571B